VETQGPLATLWVSFGLIAFYIALIWINTLLGVFLTPLFIIPGTWLMDRVQERRRNRAQRPDEPPN
jgi:predicted Na+-dependent transporter